MRFKHPEVSASVVMACCYLHNFIRDTREEFENDDAEFMEIEDDNVGVIPPDEDDRGPERIFNIFSQNL